MTSTLPDIDVTPSSPHTPLATLEMNSEALERAHQQRAKSRAEKLEDFLENLYAQNTEQAYRGDWRHWLAWCAAEQRDPLPASVQDVLDYLLDYADVLKPSTLERRLITIGKAHKSFDHPSPTRDERIKQAFKGLVRKRGRRTRRAAPLTASEMRDLIDALDDHPGLLSTRDRALLLVGWFGAFRQSELVALRLDEITAHGEEERSLFLPRSKTDQSGEGHRKWLTKQVNPKYCPLRAIDDWVEQAELAAASGPLLRAVGRWDQVGEGALRPQAVTDAIRRAATLAGYESEIYSGHSLRRGFCVQAALNGATLDEIMAQTHHRDIATVMRYIEEANSRRRNAVRKVEL